MNKSMLPDGWVFVPLEEIAEIVGGGTPSRTKPEYFGGNLVWLTPSEIPKNRISTIFDSKERITLLGLQKSSARIIPKGSVLMTSRASIGYVAIAGTEVTTNQGFASFICEDGVDNLYLAYWLWSNADEFVHLATGTTFKEISKSKLRKVTLPLAPLNEQRRIVEAIEALFSRLNAGVAALKRMQASLKRYKASVLKAACEGQLVPQDPDDEPASELLARILAERRARWEADQLAQYAAQGKQPPKNWQQRYQEPQPPDTSDLPGLPEGWVWTDLKTLIVWGPQNGLYLPQERYGTGTPILRIDDFQSGWSRQSSELRLVDADDSEVEKYCLQLRDLVVNRVNSLTHLGKCLLINERNLPALFESNMMRMRLADNIIARYIEYYLTSTTGHAFLTKDAKWAVNQASINQVDVGNTLIPLPPYQEQYRIISEADRIFSVIAEQESIFDTTLKRADRLRQAILREAFAGRLVPQDPNDEPASALLERIRAEREARK